MFLRRLQGRALPDFLIIGAQKSGTSSLFRYLDRHPQVRGSVPKEVHYFDGGLAADVDSYARGPRWYRAHFPLRSELAGKQAFEASPLYLLLPLAAERIAALLPGQARRDPAQPDRPGAVHRFTILRSNTCGSSARTTAPGDDGGGGAAGAGARGRRLQRIFRAFTYKARGHLEQLQRYLDRFRENLLVLRAEDLFEDRRADGSARRLPRARPRRPRPRGDERQGNRAPVDPGVRGARAYFAPHNRALAAYPGPAGRRRAARNAERRATREAAGMRAARPPCYR
jgi:hypothetical protein